jgi:hypothetical protein
VTGLALLLAPSLVGRLLFDEELTGTGIPAGRVTGIALIALGVAWWPGPPMAGMLIYSAAVTLYLAYVGPGSRFGRQPSVAGRRSAPCADRNPGAGSNKECAMRVL